MPSPFTVTRIDFHEISRRPGVVTAEPKLLQDTTLEPGERQICASLTVMPANAPEHIYVAYEDRLVFFNIDGILTVDIPEIGVTETDDPDRLRLTFTLHNTSREQLHIPRDTKLTRIAMAPAA